MISAKRLAVGAMLRGQHQQPIVRRAAPRCARARPRGPAPRAADQAGKAVEAVGRRMGAAIRSRAAVPPGADREEQQQEGSRADHHHGEHVPGLNGEAPPRHATEPRRGEREIGIGGAGRLPVVADRLRRANRLRSTRSAMRGESAARGLRQRRQRGDLARGARRIEPAGPRGGDLADAALEQQMGRFVIAAFGGEPVGIVEQRQRLAGVGRPFGRGLRRLAAAAGRRRAAARAERAAIAAPPRSASRSVPGPDSPSTRPNARQRSRSG